MKLGRLDEAELVVDLSVFDVWDSSVSWGSVYVAVFLNSEQPKGTHKFGHDLKW